MKYQKAPITEAIIDIRVKARSNLNVDDLRSLADENYSQVSEQLQIAATFKVGSPANQSLSPVLEGFRFNRPDKSSLFQAKKSGWAFNQLPPYSSWEEFQSRGRELWVRYRNLAQPEEIGRVALRYINRLEVPLPLKDFREYLLTVPDVAPKLPQGLSNFLMQLHMPLIDIGALAILNVAMPPASDDNFVAIILDIDVFRAHDVPQTDRDIWDYFEELRKKKNDIFEASITDAMRARFI